MNDNWQALNDERPELRDKLKELFHKDDSFVIKPIEFVEKSLLIPINEIMIFLDKAASIGLLTKSIEYYCPFEDCGSPLSKIEINDGICTKCGQAYIDSLSKKPIDEILYFRHAMTGRDVRWFLALHGMNTRGAWQEEFNWRVANTFGRSIPVAIYKYGIIRFSVLLGFLQKRLLRKLYKRFNSLVGDIQGNGLGLKPDIIAHSFGTWMIGQLLKSFPEIKVGRVILTGSILRPDFNWSEIIKNGQAEAVLNHFSKNDIPVQLAHFFIPNSGPSGFRGFDDPNVINVEATNCSHSAYFNISNMKKFFKSIWWPFLQKNKIELNNIFPINTQNNKWRQCTWILRGRLIPWIVLILVTVFLITIVFALIIGFKQIILFRISDQLAGISSF